MTSQNVMRWEKSSQVIVIDLDLKRKDIITKIPYYSLFYSHLIHLIILILVRWNSTTCIFGLTEKQTGHPRPWHWWEVSAHSAELWPGHRNGLPYLHETETGPPHWPGLASSGGPYHVGSAAVQQDPGSHGSISTGDIEFLPPYSDILRGPCGVFVNLQLIWSYTVPLYPCVASGSSFHTRGQENHQKL